MTGGTKKEGDLARTELQSKPQSEGWEDCLMKLGKSITDELSGRGGRGGSTCQKAPRAQEERFNHPSSGFLGDQPCHSVDLWEGRMQSSGRGMSCGVESISDSSESLWT